MNQGWADSVVSGIERRTLAEAQRLRGEIADDVRKSIGVPVGRGAGGVTVRSKSGEPPRRDEGDLYRSVGHRVRVGAGRVELEIHAGGRRAPHAAHLEKRMNRRFMAPAYDRWKGRVPGRLADAAAGR